MNTSRLQLPWVNADDSTHVQSPRPTSIILIIYVTTSYDEPSADAIIVNGLECAV